MIFILHFHSFLITCCAKCFIRIITTVQDSMETDD